MVEQSPEYKKKLAKSLLYACQFDEAQAVLDDLILSGKADDEVILSLSAFLPAHQAFALISSLPSAQRVYSPAWHGLRYLRRKMAAPPPHPDAALVARYQKLFWLLVKSAGLGMLALLYSSLV